MFCKLMRNISVKPNWELTHNGNIQHNLVYNSRNRVIINKIGKMQLKLDAISRSILNGVREPNLFSFALDETRAFSIFCGPKTNLY